MIERADAGSAHIPPANVADTLTMTGSLACVCPKCGKHYRNIPADLAGRRIRCRECQAAVDVPASVDDGDPDREFDAAASAQRARFVKAAAGRKVATEPVDNVEVEQPKKKRKKKSKNKNKEFEWTLWHAYGLACLVGLFLCWSKMASAYARDTEGWIAGVVDEHQNKDGTTTVLVHRKVAAAEEAKNAFTRLLQSPSIIAHTLRYHKSIPLLTIIILALLAGGTYWATLLEVKMKGEDKRRERLNL